MKLNRVLCSCSKVAAIIIAALSFSDFGVAATPRNWIGPNGLGGSGNWNTAGNWSPAGVPGTNDDSKILLSNGTSRTSPTFRQNPSGGDFWGSFFDVSRDVVAMRPESVEVFC